LRLVTIQDKAAYTELCETGVLRCKPELAEWLNENCFLKAYNWLVEQMKQRIGEPTPGVTYPIWAWHLLDGKPAKVDLRKREFNNYFGEQYALTIEVPDNLVLLSDEENWHFVLNGWHFGDSENESDYDKEDAWFDALPPDEKQAVKLKSWERIFDVRPYKSEWRRSGLYVQATFWELRMEQVIKIKRFIGRQKKQEDSG